MFIIPLIPILAVLAMFGGGGTLAWYLALSEERQQEADEIACKHAKRLFDKAVKDLSKDQADRVYRLTKQHFEN